MNACDYEAYTYNSDVYCCECLPVDTTENTVSPIFASDEWDYYPVCLVCGTTFVYIQFIPHVAELKDLPVLTITYNGVCRNTAKWGDANFIECDPSVDSDWSFCDVCGVVLTTSYWLCLDGGEAYCEDCIVDAEEME